MEDYKKELDKYKNLSHEPVTIRGMTDYYYLVAKIRGKTGVKIVIDGPHASELEATNMARSLSAGSYTVVSLKTRDLARATSEIKHLMAAKQGDIGIALNRVAHSIG